MLVMPAIARLNPQVLDLDDRYFTAAIGVGPDATEDRIEVVRTELPIRLAQEVGGPARHFELSYHAEWGYRWLTLRRKLLPGVFKEGRRSYVEELLDWDVYKTLERLVQPRYQGSVYAKMAIRTHDDGHIPFVLVLQCGRWRVCLDDLNRQFPGLTHLSIERKEMRFCLPGILSDEAILETVQEIAAYLELHTPSYVRLHDPKGNVPTDLLSHASRDGSYHRYLDYTF